MERNDPQFAGQYKNPHPEVVSFLSCKGRVKQLQAWANQRSTTIITCPAVKSRAFKLGNQGIHGLNRMRKVNWYNLSVKRIVLELLLLSRTQMAGREVLDGRDHRRNWIRLCL